VAAPLLSSHAARSLKCRISQTSKNGSDSAAASILPVVFRGLIVPRSGSFSGPDFFYNMDVLPPGDPVSAEVRVAAEPPVQEWVSAHLACLAGCGYVQARRQGRNAFYRVADPRVADLVVLARSMAADNAAALAACMYISPAPAGSGAELAGQP
jgi:hypothetical protein